jgi:hypothetical protein
MGSRDVKRLNTPALISRQYDNLRYATFLCNSLKEDALITTKRLIIFMAFSITVCTFVRFTYEAGCIPYLDYDRTEQFAAALTL